MTFQNFLTKYNGQQNVGNTPENKGECVGLVAVWVDELGLDHLWGNAKDLMYNYNPIQFDFILNTPDAIPKAGDIVCWNKNMGGGYGHTAIIVKADINTFEVFEQNNPTGYGCRLHTYPNYNNVQGFIHPKNISVPSSDALTECLKQHGELVGKLDLTEKTINNLNGQIDQLNKEKNLLADELKVCKNNSEVNQELNDKLVQITQELNQIKLDYEQSKSNWQLKEVALNKQITLLTTKYNATKSSIKKLLVDYIFGKG